MCRWVGFFSCSVCFCVWRVVFCCRNTPWVQMLTSKSTSFFFIVGFYVKLLTCSQVWQLWTAGWAVRAWVTGRPGPWTLSHRPTQGSNSTRLPPCPPSTASPYCSNRALRAARKRVWTHTLGIGYIGSVQLKLVQLQLSCAADMELHQWQKPKKQVEFAFLRLQFNMFVYLCSKYSN